ncbi:MAG: hypothetical protein Q7T56_04460 [Nocardioidaceae bacterium]|nr:hypothetical protein [Nocardioidaceae bacterium]
MDRHLLRRVGTVVLAASVPLAGLAATPASAAPGGVVVRRDVDGDGRKDTVSVKTGTGSATVTVDRARGRTLTKRLRTEGVPASAVWHGSAAIDGRRGAELVLVTTAGAHTLFNTVLTIQAGELRVSRTPGGASTWVTDGAYTVNVGWRRYTRDGQVFMTKRVVLREISETWSGRAVTWRWTSGGWVRSGRAKALRPTDDRVAYRYGGWRVAGLKTYP